VRKRLSLPRLPKRTTPQSQAKRFTSKEKQQVKDYIQKNAHLGALRLSWDIVNILNISISASTVLRWRKEMKEIQKVEVVHWQFYERKHPHSLWHGDFLKFEQRWNDLNQITLQDDYSRGYIFCELTTVTTAHYVVQCLIRAMRQWKVVPKALLFDNESIFKANLLKSFCKNLGIQTIYITARHPQTNGKLERAFRDDQRDFYSLRKGWSIEELQKDLPDYIHYRNYERGHLALNGKPAINRLREQNWFALPSVLKQLEEYAVCEAGEKCVDLDGYMHILGRPLYLGKRFGGSVVKCFETMNGFEIRNGNFVIGTLPDYQEYRRLYNNTFNSDTLPNKFVLQRNKKLNKSPLIAVAL
jgi:transposase InsO family protein